MGIIVLLWIYFQHYIASGAIIGGWSLHFTPNQQQQIVNQFNWSLGQLNALPHLPLSLYYNVVLTYLCCNKLRQTLLIVLCKI